MRRRHFLALAGLAVTASACTTTEPEPTETPEQVLARAKERFDEASGVKLALDLTLPQGVAGVSKADGVGIISDTTPKFKGTVTATFRGTPATIDVVAVGDDTWLSVFGATTKVDMASLNAPNPASFFKPSGGVSSILTATTDAAAGDKVREGEIVLQTYTGKLPAQALRDLLALSVPDDELDVTYGIEPTSGELRTAAVTGQMFAGGTSTLTVTLSDYGTTLDIQPPG